MVNEVKRGRFNSYLVRLLGMQVTAPAPQLNNVIIPTMNIEDPSDDHWFAQGWWLCSGAVDIAAVAAKSSTALLRNPAGSGVLAVLDELIFSTTAPTDDRWAGGVVYTSSDLAQLPSASDITATLDTRYGTALKNPSLHLTYDNNPPLNPVPKNRFDLWVLQYTPIILRKVAVLGPGGAFALQNFTNNVATTVAMRWRERPVSDLELAQG